MLAISSGQEHKIPGHSLLGSFLDIPGPIGEWSGSVSLESWAFSLAGWVLFPIGCPNPLLGHKFHCKVVSVPSLWVSVTYTPGQERERVRLRLGASSPAVGGQHGLGLGVPTKRNVVGGGSNVRKRLYSMQSSDFRMKVLRHEEREQGSTGQLLSLGRPRGESCPSGKLSVHRC